METEPETKPGNSARGLLASVIVIVVIAAMVAGVKLLSGKKSGQPVANSGASTGFGTSSSGAATTSFKDGSYTATGDYESPGGDESITVSVTLKGGVITATSAQSGANDPTADMFQNDFIQGYKSLVVGQPISSVNLSKISGSSLTSQGFNDAITKIENEAKV